MDPTEISSTTKTDSPPKRLGLKLLLIFVLILGFVTSFIAGFGMSSLIKQSVPSVAETPTPSIIPVVQKPPTLQAGNHYFDDTIILVTKDAPRVNLIASVTRKEQGDNFLENTRVSYFNGSSWVREMNAQTISDATIVGNALIGKWNITFDPSRVLKQDVQGTIQIKNNQLDFSTGTLQNEMVIRSLPGYTKFMSEGSGTIKINGEARSVYVLYTRIYSQNADDIQTYSTSLGLTTHWVAFWDANGNFYHIDTTSVDKPTQIYQTHQLAVAKDVDGRIAKVFQTIVHHDQQSPPISYDISLPSPIGEQLNVSRVNGINKAPNGSYVWYMGNIEGTIDGREGKRTGIGLVEYIHD